MTNDEWGHVVPPRDISHEYKEFHAWPNNYTEVPFPLNFDSFLYSLLVWKVYGNNHAFIVKLSRNDANYKEMNLFINNTNDLEC